VILCEACQPPQDVRQYFGNGDEFHMGALCGLQSVNRLDLRLVGFHFPLMPRIFLSIKSENYSSLRDIMAETPDIPANCQWVTFLRNHDELTLEMVTPEERQFMWREYAPEPRMRLNLGIRRRLAPLVRARFVVSVFGKYSSSLTDSFSSTTTCASWSSPTRCYSRCLALPSSITATKLAWVTTVRAYNHTQ
jgi:hypothetical protein